MQAAKKVVKAVRMRLQSIKKNYSQNTSVVCLTGLSLFHFQTSVFSQGAKMYQLFMKFCGHVGSRDSNMEGRHGR